MNTGERDFPIGHPKAPDYKGEKYTPPSAPHSQDFEKGNPARGGANTNPSDTPDGFHALQLKADAENARITAESENLNDRVPATVEQLKAEVMSEGVSADKAAIIAQKRFDGDYGDQFRYLLSADQTTA